MSIHSRCILSVSAAALLMLSAASASADGTNPEYDGHADSAPSGAAMAADIALARPLGLVATLLGTVVFVAGLPFELLAGNVSDPARRLVGDPARYTFTRPLGEGIN